MEITARPDLTILINEIGTGGAEQVILQIVAAACERGLRVDVVMANTGGARVGLLDPRARQVSLGVKRMHYGVLAYRRYLREVRPGCVMATVENAVVVALLGGLLCRHRPRLVIRIANSLKRERGRPGYWAYWGWRQVAKWLYRRADRVIAVSKGLRRELVEELGIDAKKVIAIPNPIDALKVQRRIEAARKTTNEFYKPYILSIGRLAPQKDFETLLRAFARMTKFSGDLVILGEGEERRRLESLAEELGIRDRLHLPGFRMDPMPVLAHARAFVLSSRHEGMSNALLEAVAAGLACISTDSPHGAREILGDGAFGRLVTIGDAVGLGAALEKTVGEPEAPKMNARLRQHLQAFALDTVIDQYLKVSVGEARQRKKLTKSVARKRAIAAP